VLRIRIQSDPDPDRILELINDPISTFLVFVKAIITYIYILLRAYFHKKKSRKKLAVNLFRSGSGSGTGSGRFQKTDPDPVKNRPDPQHCLDSLRPVLETKLT
jgi:hypothetical protein